MYPHNFNNKEETKKNKKKYRPFDVLRPTQRVKYYNHINYT